MSDSENDRLLSSARAEIDSIDAEIYSLLLRREASVCRVMAAKGGTGEGGGSALRFGREARILRRLYDLHSASGSGLSFLSVYGVWRELMSGFTLLQGGYGVDILHEKFLGLARGHFGGAVSIGLREDEHVKSDNLLLVGHPTDSRWWLCLAESGDEDGGNRIVSALPFVREGSEDMAPEGYVLGDCVVDFSSDNGEGDIICMALEFSEDVSLSDEALMGALMAELLCPIAVSGGWLYCERNGRLPSGESISVERWQEVFAKWESQFSARGLRRIRWLGSYARPLALNIASQL